MPATAAGWTALAIGTGVTVAAVQRQQETKGAKKARSSARKRAGAAQERQRRFLELQAGEFDLITEKQMKIQAMQSQTKSLVELLDRQKPAPRVLTLPTPRSTDPVLQINRAIDDFIKGRN